MDAELETTETLEETPSTEEDVETLEEGNEDTEITEEEAEDSSTEESTTFTQKQVESAVKTRVNTLNRKIDKLKPYEIAVKKISEITGQSVTDLISRLETMSDVEQAKILGITPQQFTQQKAVTQATRTANETTLKLQRELEEQKLVIKPEFKDYPLYKVEIDELLEDNPKLTIEQAYLLAKGETATKAAVRDAEQRAVAKMTKSSNQKVVKPGQAPKTTGPKLDAATIAAAKRVGMDPAEYAAFSNISSLDQFEKFKTNKKG